MLTVYRVEHEDGRGPYHWTFDDPHVGNPGYDRIPTPEEDGITFFPYFYRFGFKDLDQLQAWFNEPDRRKLKRKGFVIRVYQTEPENVIEGGKQLVFDRDGSVCVGELPIH